MILRTESCENSLTSRPYWNILKRRIKESLTLREIALHPLLLAGIALSILHWNRLAYTLFSQIHRSTRLKRLKEAVLPFIRANLPINFGSQKGGSPDEILKQLGKRIMVLKEPPTPSEKGVLYIMFSETIERLTTVFDMNRLLADYTLVFEPSWSGYCDPGILQYTQYQPPIFILAAEKDDFLLLENLRSNLVPIDLGPCDWVDPSICEEYLDLDKQYDMVMNAHWGPSKRHHVLFKAMRRLPLKMKVALIGVPWEGGSMAEIHSLAEHYGVLSQISFFERIPYEEVMKITCQSRIGILLSLKEGSNRALAEQMFCNLPVILLENHVGGIRKNVVSETGMIIYEDRLSSGIIKMLASSTCFTPRSWACKNISCLISTAKLNAFLKSNAFQQGNTWTHDIVVRTNSPESKYYYNEDEIRMRHFNEDLKSYVKEP